MDTENKVELKLVNLQCYIISCVFNKGGGCCGHNEPSIKLSSLVGEKFICFSRKDKEIKKSDSWKY